MNTPHGSPVVLHVEFGIQFLSTMLDRFGSDCWNRWLYAVLDRIPMSWGEGEDEPPARLWFDARQAEFRGMILDGADLGLFDCEEARLDGASAVGAMFGCVRHASFRNADLRDAIFIGDVSGASFADARMDGVSLADATYDPADPPVGLTDALLRACREEHDGWPPDGDPAVAGLVEHPVHVKASLAESSTR